MSTSPPANNPKTPLDAAQKIVAELQGMAPDHQFLAVKFALEAMGLQMPSATPQHSPATTTPPQHSAPAPPAPGCGHSMDIKSFTAIKAPKSDQQFAAVVAYYYQFEAPLGHRKEGIDVETMKHAARLASRKQPPNWRFTLQNAKNSGYLDPAGEGSYRLSPVGENLVAITLPGSGSAPVTGKRRLSPKPPKKVAKKSR